MESSGLHWTPQDFDWTLSLLDWDWTLKSGLQSSGTGLDWTGLQWTGLCTSQFGLAKWALESTGVQWSPVESIWIMWGRVKTSAPGLISTTTDMWSADTTKAAFLGVTAHWIDMKGREGGETWAMCSEVISFRSVSGDHSGKTLGWYFVSVCNRIGIMNTKRSKVQSGLSIRF